MIININDSEKGLLTFGSEEQAAEYLNLKVKHGKEMQAFGAKYFSRPSVLREEWMPSKDGERSWSVSPTNFIREEAPFSRHGYMDSNPLYYFSFYKSGGYVFVPSLELAEEIVQIREGKWLAKDKDSVFVVDRNNKYFCYNKDAPSVMQGDTTALMFSKYIYFPSAKQRDAFIAKNKPKEDLRDVHAKKSFELISKATSLAKELESHFGYGTVAFSVEFRK